MSKPRIQKFLILSFGVIFFVTGVAKLWSSYGSSRVLLEYDPIFGTSFYRLMQVAGAVEVGLAFFCWWSCRVMTARSLRMAAILVAWFSTLLMGYRLALSYVDWHHPCRCMGDFTEALHIPEDVTENMVKAMLVYLLIGSYSLLIWQRKVRLPGGRPVADPGNQEILHQSK